MDTSELIAKLSDEGAATPSTHPLKQAFLWILGTAIFMIAAASLEGLRFDIDKKLHSSAFIAEIVLLIAVGISATIISFYHTRPEGVRQHYVTYTPFILLLSWLGIALFTSANTFDEYSLDHAFHLAALGCPCHIILITAIPVYMLFYVIRMGATVKQRTTGGMGMLGVTTFGYVFMRFVEPTDDLVHLMVWHALPIALMCVAAAFISKRLLRW